MLHFFGVERCTIFGGCSTKKEGIETITAENIYEPITDMLREINKKGALYQNDYDMAIDLINVPLENRYTYLEDKIYQNGNIY